MKPLTGFLVLIIVLLLGICYKACSCEKEVDKEPPVEVDEEPIMGSSRPMPKIFIYKKPRPPKEVTKEKGKE